MMMAERLNALLLLAVDRDASISSYDFSENDHHAAEKHGDNCFF